LKCDIALKAFDILRQKKLEIKVSDFRELPIVFKVK